MVHIFFTSKSGHFFFFVFNLIGVALCPGFSILISDVSVVKKIFGGW